MHKLKKQLLTAATPQEWDTFLTCHADYYADKIWTPDFHISTRHLKLIKKFRKIYQTEGISISRNEQMDNAIKLLEDAGIWEPEKIQEGPNVP